MAVVVQKFGGSSVATAERIMAAARRAIRAKQAGNQVIVVVSARGDTTDDLIALAREITEQPARPRDGHAPRHRRADLHRPDGHGHPGTRRAGHQLHRRRRSASSPTAPTPRPASRRSPPTRMRQALDDGKIVIVAGFQGIDEHDNITTLGRGGSDTTAVALAAAHEARPARRNGKVDCEIYTDVDGVYTTDPRIVPEARKMDAISYDEMLELASIGAGVMHSRSIEFAKKFDVPLMVRNVVHRRRGHLDRARGRLDAPSSRSAGRPSPQDEARIVLEGVPDRPGVSHRVFAAIAEQNIVVDMIAQNVGSGGKATIGFTVLRNELHDDARRRSQPLAAELGGDARAETRTVSKVSVVGTGMRTHTGVAERMFAALAAEGVNMKMITTGDIKISRAGGQGRRGARRCGRSTQAFGLDEAAARRRRGRPGRRRRRLPAAGRAPRRTPQADLATGHRAALPAWKTSSSATCS